MCKVNSDHYKGGCHYKGECMAVMQHLLNYLEHLSNLGASASSFIQCYERFSFEKSDEENLQE